MVERPHCLNRDACKASPKATHCRSCESISRWSRPGMREQVGAKIRAAIAANGRPPFRDEVKARHAVLYAQAFGLKRASEMLGMNEGNLSRWRKRLERLDGKSYQKPETRQPKLSFEQALEIHRQLADGEKHEYLAALYGVHASAIGRVKRGSLYPAAKQAADLAAWNRLGRKVAA